LYNIIQNMTTLKMEEKLLKAKYHILRAKEKNLLEVQETRQKAKLSTSGGTSDARFIKDIAPCIEFGLVGNTMHQVNERSSIKDMKKLKLIYLKIIKSFFN